MRRVRKVLMRCIEKLTALGGAIGSVFIVVLLVLIVVEVISRSVFSFSTGFAEEGAAHLYLGIAFMGLAYTLKAEGHVTVTTLCSRLTPRAREILSLITYAVGIVFAGLLALECSSLVAGFYKTGSLSVVSRMPLWIAMTLMPAGLILLALQMAAEFIEKARSLIRGKSGAVPHEPPPEPG